MRLSTNRAAGVVFEVPAVNTAGCRASGPLAMLRAVGLAIGIAAIAGSIGCAGKGGADTASSDGQAGGRAGAPLVADESGMNKAAKDLAELFEKRRAAEAQQRLAAGSSAGAAGGTDVSGGRTQMQPVGDVGPVTVRDPAGKAGDTGARTNPAGDGRAVGSAGTPSGSASAVGVGSQPVRGEANMPMSLDAGGQSAGRSRNSEAAQVVRTRLMTEHLRELSLLLEQDATAPVSGKATGQRSNDGKGAAGAGSLVSSAMVLAALAPMDASAADRYTALRGRLDEDEVHIADTVRRIVEASRSGEVKGADGSKSDGRITDRASPVLSAKGSVAIVGSNVSALSQVVLDSAITLDEQRGLRIGALALTTAVESFGRYTPMDASRFIAGRKVPILLYTELANFSNNAGDSGLDDSGEGKFSVGLLQEVTLRNESDGTVAVDFGPQDYSSRARAARRDLFLTRRLELPANLSIGTYVLNVRVRDRATNAEAESKIRIEVGAK